MTGSTFAGKFVDPNLPAGYTTYNVQNIGGNIYVTYADLAAGAVLGNGFVDEFDSSGNLLQRIATGGALDEPWGITMAPASGFGTYSGDLLIGNFGNGWINAYSPSGAFLGSLDGVNGTPLVNNSLWALDFGNGGPGFNADTLYFTAGINNQQDGLFGEIQAVPEPGAAGTFAFGMMAILVAFRRGLAARAPRR